MRFIVIGLFLTFSKIIYAENVGAGSGTVSPAESKQNAQWSTYHQTHHPHNPSGDLSIMVPQGPPQYFVDQNGQTWKVVQASDGSLWAENSQGQFKPYTPDN